VQSSNQTFEPKTATLLPPNKWLAKCYNFFWFLKFYVIETFQKGEKYLYQCFL